MTTFPRELLTPLKSVSGGFVLNEQVVLAPTRGSLQQVANIGTPIWSIRYQTPIMREAQGLAWEAWIASLRGGARLFKAYDPMRRYAVNYAAGYGGMTRHSGSSFDGTANLSAIGGSRDTATISTLPSTFAIAPGDLFSITSGSTQSLHRAITGGTATAGVITVECEPTIPVAVTTGAVVQLEKPWIKASLDRKTVRIEWRPGRVCAVAFEAWQTQ